MALLPVSAASASVQDVTGSVALLSLEALYHPEVFDKQSRYGKSMALFFDVWKNSKSPDDFNTWLTRLADGEFVPGAGKLKALKLIKKDGTLANISRVQYLDRTQRKAYKMVVNQDGLVSTKHNKGLLDSSSIPTEEPYIFVISPDDEVYIGVYDKGTFNHSSFLSGGAVKSAGVLIVENGKIVAIEDNSGHYQPSPKMMVNALRAFEKRGINIDEITVIIIGKEEDEQDQEIPARDFLAQHG